MTSSAPWSVKGIDPKARETAKELARKSGMTLGQWISSRIREEQALLAKGGASVTDLAERRQKPAAKQTESFETLAARIEDVEKRSALAVTGIDQFVRGALSRLDTSEREQFSAAARIEGAIQNAQKLDGGLADRVAKLEADASGPRSAEALKSLEGALGRVANHLYKGETKTQETLVALQKRLDTLEQGGGLADKVAANIGARLDQAEARTTAALHSLRDSFAQLDKRLTSAESRIEGGDGFSAMSPAVERRLESLANNLTQGVDAVRAEMAQRLRETGEGRFEQVDRAVAEMTAHVADAERRSAQAIEKMGSEVLRIAESMGKRVEAVEQRSAEAIDRIGADFSRAFDNLDARLQRSESSQAEALERLGGEIARITEQFAERAGASERRSAQAIDDIGSKVSEVSERLGERYDRHTIELTDRIRQSEERTARLLAEARERLDQKLGAAPAAAARPDDLVVSPFAEDGEQGVPPQAFSFAATDTVSFDPPAFGAVGFDAAPVEEFEAPKFDAPTFDAPRFDAPDFGKAVETEAVEASSDEEDDNQTRSVAERSAAPQAVYSEPWAFGNPFAPAGLESAEAAAESEEEPERSEGERAFFEDFAFNFAEPLPPETVEAEAEADAEVETLAEDPAPVQAAAEDHSAEDHGDVYLWLDPEVTEALLAAETEETETLAAAEAEADEAVAEESPFAAFGASETEDALAIPAISPFAAFAADDDQAATDDTVAAEGAQTSPFAADFSFGEAESSADAEAEADTGERYSTFSSDFDPVERAFAQLDPSYRSEEVSEAESFGAMNASQDDLADHEETLEAEQTVEASEPERPLTTRELIEQARAAARAASDDSMTRWRASERRPSSQGGGRRRSGMTNALLISGTAAALTVSIAGYVLLNGDRRAPQGMVADAQTADLAGPLAPTSTPRAAVALNPEPINPAAPLAAGKADDNAKTLYADAVEKIKSENKEGVDPLREAAKLGYAPAQLYLGKLYETGEAGVAKNMVEARRWTERAAVAGDPKAMHNLALYLFKGEGGSKNTSAAAVWFQRAADLGLTDSQYNLGRLYEEGIGVTQNAAEAYKWYVIATRAGDTESRAAAGRVKSRLSAQAVAAAEKSAGAFSAQTVNSSIQISAQAGADVLTAQEALTQLGYYKGATTGVSSPAMKLAVQAFQRDQGLPDTGLVDEATLGRLSNFSR